jgi:hypothetical protein
MFGWLKKKFPDPGEVLARLERVESSMRVLQVEAEAIFEKTQRAAWRAGKARPLLEGPPEPVAPVDPRIAHLDPVSRRIVELRRAKHPLGGNGKG